MASITTRAQSVNEQQEAVRSAVQSGNWSTAITELTKLRSSAPDLFREKAYDYLLARLAEKTGELATANAGYQIVASTNGPLASYATWHLAHIARSTGDLVQEREHLRKLVAGSPRSLLFDAAALRLAESFYESGDYHGAADAARRLTVSKNVSLTREASTILGQAFFHLGQDVEARDVFTRLLMQMPDAARPDDFALTAVRELDALDKKSTETSPVKLSESDHLLRASVYQFNRDFAGARAHYQYIIDNYPHSPTLPNAIYQLGRGLYLESRYDEAIKALRRVVDEFSETPNARDALGYVASSYLRLKRPDDAIAAYKELINRFPDAPNPERPYLNIIDALHEAGRYSEAMTWAQQTRTRFKNSVGGALALFAQLRIHLAQGAWAAAVSDADELSGLGDLGGTRVPGGTFAPEVRFLRAYALEQQGRIDEAIAAYLAISDGRNEYYGARSTQRLLSLAANENAQGAIQGKLNALLGVAKSALVAGQFEQARIALQSSLRLATDDKTRAAILHDLQTAYEALPNYKLPAHKLNTLIEPGGGDDKEKRVDDHRLLAETLAWLGLYDEAVPELFASRATANAATSNSKSSASLQGQSPGVSDAAYTIAVYSLRGGLPSRAVRFAEEAWKSVPADYVLDLAPREFVELLYPAPYREALLKHAVSRNVDPRFVLSIARQESRYQTDAKSVAAARGMMQFIPATANEIATQLKLNNFNQDDLYDADLAILFGSQYLANLFEQFPNQPDAVAAAYNGGADNMVRWQSRSRSKEPDRYVPEIGFSQSKDYVFRVMTNYWNYLKLYDSQFRPVPGTPK